jgi:oxygen-dependent protoporphyrinogen oxidase
MKTTEKDVVIIGAGLTGLSLAFYLKKAGKNVLLIEKNNRTGGVIHTNTENGFTYETGPSTGVIGTLEIAELFEDLKGYCELETANQQAKKRYIWKKMKWEALPSGHDFGAITTPLFTLKDKFRILGEPFRKVGQFPDESIAALVRRRLGRSFLDYAVDPFISGVYAGDPEKLVTRFALPKLYQLEQNYGSFVRGAIKKHKEPKEPYARKITREVFSVKGGFNNFITALNLAVGNENILLDCKNTKIKNHTNGFVTTYTDKSGKEIEVLSKYAVTTVGGYDLPGLLPFLDKVTIKPLSQTTYASVVQVAAGYNNWTGIKLDAFGGLVPSIEKRKILGVLFPSAIFTNRAPVNGALLSVFLGGINKPEMYQKSDSEIKQLVYDELRLTMHIETEPDLLRIHRYQYAIAQYDFKTGERLMAIDHIQNHFPGLFLGGSIRDGIGMADRVKQAKMIANQLIGE